MARILNEKFEAAGYDVAGWSETVGAGCTVDEDTAASAAGSPSEWGSQCLKIMRAASQNAFVSRTVSETNTYVRIEVVVGAEGLGNTEAIQIARAYDETDSKDLYELRLQQRSNGTLCFMLNVYLDGDNITDYYAIGVPVSLNTRYRIEIKWDVASNAFEWKIDGTSINSVSLSGSHATHMTTFRLGTPSWDTALTYTLYYDLVAIDDATWVGAEPAASTWTPRVIMVM